MNADTVKKLAIAALVLFLALPMLPTVMRVLRPPAVTFERFKAALEAQMFSVDNFNAVKPGDLESTAMATMFVSGAEVAVYYYAGEGPIVKNLEYQKPDAGGLAAGAMGIAQSLGARVQHVVPSIATRNGLTMLVVRSEDKELNKRIAAVFENL